MSITYEHQRRVRTLVILLHKFFIVPGLLAIMYVELGAEILL